MFQDPIKELNQIEQERDFPLLKRILESPYKIFYLGSFHALNLRGFFTLTDNSYSGAENQAGFVVHVIDGRILTVSVATSRMFYYREVYFHSDKPPQIETVLINLALDVLARCVAESTEDIDKLVSQLPNGSFKDTWEIYG
jgi:hypothetical protein